MRDLHTLAEGLCKNIRESDFLGIDIIPSRSLSDFHRGTWYTRDDNDRFILTHADVNRDYEQYKETNDELDRKMITYLIDSLLQQDPESLPPGCQ
jgi:hypothetical protein